MNGLKSKKKQIKMNKSKKVLIIAAHPDDEILGCGGAIIKHIHAGDEVYIMVFADGVTARVYRPGVPREDELENHKKDIDIRKTELFDAAKILGVKEQNCHCFSLPDQRLDAFPLLDLVKKIEEIAQNISPDIIYAHHWGDINKDHRVVCEAALTAFRPAACKGKDMSIYFFEILGNMDLLPPGPVHEFKPDHFIDISSCFQTKIKALKAYQSELRDYPSPLSQKSIMELSRQRGKESGCEYAEAFVAFRRKGGQL